MWFHFRFLPINPRAILHSGSASPRTVYISCSPSTAHCTAPAHHTPRADEHGPQLILMTERSDSEGSDRRGEAMVSKAKGRGYDSQGH